MIKAVAVLKEHNVLEENIVLSNLFCTPVAVRSITAAFPQVSDYVKTLDKMQIPATF